MPFEEIMRKYKNKQPMSNGRKIASRSQAIAIASKYPHEGGSTQSTSAIKRPGKGARGFASLDKGRTK